MNNYLDKTPTKKLSSAASQSIQRKNNSSAFHFADNRTATAPVQKSFAPNNNSIAQLAAVGGVIQLGKESKKKAATERNANKKAKAQS